MTNPYDILKISSDSSKAEIDASYCRLMEEYTREKSGDNVTNDIAEYKINELKTAYNQIIDQLKNNSALMGQVSYDSINPYYIASASPTVNSSKTVNNDAPDKTEEIHEASRSDYSKAPENNTNQNNDNYDYNDVFGSVKQLIDLGRYNEAENLLNSINYKDTATWHFLYGKMCLGRGWMNQAAVHFERASVLAPNNNEYRQEAIKINQMKLGQKSDFPIVPIIMGTICVESVVCLYGASYCINDICW